MPYKRNSANAEFPVNINKFRKVKGDLFYKRFYFRGVNVSSDSSYTFYSASCEHYLADED